MTAYIQEIDLSLPAINYKLRLLDSEDFLPTEKIILKFGDPKQADMIRHRYQFTVRHAQLISEDPLIGTEVSTVAGWSDDDLERLLAQWQEMLPVQLNIKNEDETEYLSLLQVSFVYCSSRSHIWAVRKFFLNRPLPLPFAFTGLSNDLRPDAVAIPSG